MGSGGRWRGFLPVALLLLLIFVIPMVQAFIPGPWDALIYATLVLVLLAELGLWRRARWARQLRRRLAVEHPNALVTIVEIWPEGDREHYLGVLQADSSGLTFFDASSSERTIEWPEVAAISNVQHDLHGILSKTFGPMSRELIHLTTTDGVIATRFRPLRGGGVNALGPFPLADFVLAVRRKRAGVVERG
ncbi:MAG: hypothetical protein QOJ77_772 [Microbacteriaceae bacterium]|nr:hypothetical protein [Microbacteriaceae bacterium]